MQEDKHSAHDEEPGLLQGKAVSATTTTTAATIATTAGPATTAGATTIVSAGPTAARKTKLGFVTPQTVTCLSNSRI